MALSRDDASLSDGDVSWSAFEDYLVSSVPQRRSLSKSKPVWIFGAGGFARHLHASLEAQGFKVAGFLQTEPHLTSLLGLPVRPLLNTEGINTSCQLLVGIFNRETSFAELEALGRTAGYDDIILPHEFYPELSISLGWKYWMDAPEAIMGNLTAFGQSYELFSDERSRKRYRDIIRFRLGLNSEYANFRDEGDQYFNALTLPFLANKRICYVDGGAFDGDSFRAAQEAVDISRALLFEPDPQNYRRLTENVAASNSSNDTLCLPLALADYYHVLSFASGTGESAVISADGDSSIAAVALDEILGSPNHRIDFLKLDIEGAEAAALNGGRELLRRSQPVIAVSLYHKSQDLWQLPALIHEILPHHTLHIIQHMFNSFESVLYALPSSANALN